MSACKEVNLREYQRAQRVGLGTSLAQEDAAFTGPKIWLFGAVLVLALFGSATAGYSRLPICSS